MRVFKRRSIKKKLICLCIIILSVVSLSVLWKRNEDSSVHDIVDVIPSYSIDLCAVMRENLLAVILVNSAAKNVNRRVLTRTTWANKYICRALGINVIFLVSNSSDPVVEAEVHKEKVDFGDILHFSLAESYRTVTQKIISGLKWTLNKCPKSLYIIKANDDVFIQIFQLSKYLNSLRKQRKKENSKDFLCLVWKGLRVERDFRFKWYVSELEYSYPTYPTCCIGSTYVMPFSVARRVVDMSTVVPFFWIEDVYITGLIAQKGSLGHQQIGALFGFMNYKYSDVIEGRIIFAYVSQNETNIKSWLWDEVINFQKKINNSLVVRPETYIVEHLATLKLYQDDYDKD